MGLNIANTYILIIPEINVRIIFKYNKNLQRYQRIILMKKQIDGQLSLFDYISEKEKKPDFNKQNHSEENYQNTRNDEYAISFFQECILCWCSTCRHNEKGQAMPRDFAGDKKPCPSCDCKLRAEEEGVSVM